MGVSVVSPGRAGRVVSPTSRTRVDTPDSGGFTPVRSGGVTIPTGLPGAPGRDGDDGQDGSGAIFEFLMPMASSTVVIDHDLGRDPVAVQVFVDGVIAEEYGVFFTIPGQQVQISFDISAVALIRLL